jgi:hypothetical protein
MTRQAGLAACLLLGAALSASATAQATPTPAPEPEPAITPNDRFLTFYLDNDLFAGEDRDYTNGIRLALISGNQDLLKLAPFHDALERMSKWEADDDTVSRWSGFASGNVMEKNLQLNYGLSLTQQMFTPQDPYSTTQPPGERRYAGWLGLGFSVHASDANALNSAELIIGTTGPRSLAEQTQDLIHEIRNIPQFEGWEDQIPNEFTLDLSLSQKRRLRLFDAVDSAFSVDGFVEGAARLGSYQTGARVGGLFRAGLHLPPDFSDPRISATAYSHQLFRPTAQRGAYPEWSLYGLLGANAGVVLFDATLDGPMFKNFDTGNTREPWLAESYLGFGARWKALEFSYVHTWRTRAYEEQDGSTNYGSLAIRLKYTKK